MKHVQSEQDDITALILDTGGSIDSFEAESIINSIRGEPSIEPLFLSLDDAERHDQRFRRRTKKKQSKRQQRDTAISRTLKKRRRLAAEHNEDDHNLIRLNFRSKIRDFMLGSAVHDTTDNINIGDLDIGDALEIIADVFGGADDKRFHIVSDGDIITLNQSSLARFANRDNINSMFQLEEDQSYGTSADDVIAGMIRMDSFRIIRIPSFNPNRSKNARNSGSAFNFMLKNFNIPMDDLQIYHAGKTEILHPELCFLFALRKLGASRELLVNLRLVIKTEKLSRDRLENLCKRFGFRVLLRTLRKKGKRGEEGHDDVIGTMGPKFKIGCILTHYFANDKPLNITRAAFKANLTEPYWKVTRVMKGRDLDSCPTSSDPKYLITPFQAIHFLKQNQEEFLIPITQKPAKMEVEDDDVETKLFEPILGEPFKFKEKTAPRYIWVYDVEAITSNTAKHSTHRPYLLCARRFDTTLPVDKQTSKMRSFSGIRMIEDFLEAMKGEETIAFAHFHSYDLQFILPKLYRPRDFIQSGSRIIMCKAANNTRAQAIFNKGKKGKARGPMPTVTFQDSFAMITSPLAKFGKMFRLKQSKEIMPFTAITAHGEDILEGKNWIDLKKVAKDPIFLESDGVTRHTGNWKQFRENCERWEGCLDQHNHPNQFNAFRYAEAYCMIDVDVLAKGMFTWRDWMKDITDGLDTFCYLSLPSIGHAYFTKIGCYEGCFKLTGQARAFIQKCIMGGRTMMANNIKFVVKNARIICIDANSLYPAVLPQYPGSLQGHPKVLSEAQIKNWRPQDYDGYFVDILVTGLMDRLPFPCFGQIDSNGTRNYSNTLVGKTIRVDRFMLEDLVKFQGMRYFVVRGYYFNDGRNKGIGAPIKALYARRKEYKKQGNPVEAAIKLLLNSASFGKHAEKPHATEIVFFPNYAEYEKFVQNNFEMIERAVMFPDCNLIMCKFRKSVDEHQNSCHIASEILSYSKSIMNRVMALAAELSIPMLYTDTDSIHMNQCDLTKLEAAYKKRYGVKLMGKELGEFSSEFNFKKEGKKVPGPGRLDIIGEYCHSRYFVACGKKVYADFVEARDETGQCWEYVMKRLKGVPSASIDYRASQAPFYGDVMKLYQWMAERADETIEFDLLNGGAKVRFKRTPALKCETISKFSRRVGFRSERVERNPHKYYVY